MSKSTTIIAILLCAACETPPADEQPRFDGAPSERPDARVQGDADTDDAGSIADASDPRDASLGSPDSGSSDSGSRDSGARDSGARDSGPPDSGPPDSGPSGTAGCGGGAHGDGAFATRSIRVGGTDRIYRILVPASYDSSRAYPVVFRWHGHGGDGLSGGLGIEYVSGEQAIIVSGDAIAGAWDLSPGGSDVAYFDALFAEVERTYCVDTDRVFSYGFSRGGGMTNLLACERGSVIRASAAVAGLAAWSASCTTPVASWFLHDTDDDAVPFGDSVAMRDRFVAANGCASTTTPTTPSPCVRYDGCTSDPVVWCQTSGFGHNIRGDFAPGAVWDFFRSLP